MRYAIICISLLLLVTSCNSIDRPKKPDNLLSEKEMVYVLVDLSLISSAKGVNRNMLEKNGVSPKEYVYKKHHIDSLQFALSNEYYAYHTDTYNEILNHVSDSLNTLKNIYQKVVDKEQMEKHIKDSITRQKRRDSLKLNREKPKPNSVL